MQFNLPLSLVPYGWFLREKVDCASLGDGRKEGDHRPVSSTLANALELNGLRNPVQDYMSKNPLLQGLNKGKGQFQFSVSPSNRTCL